MIRKKALIEVGSFRPEIESAEDMDLWLRLAEVGKLANVPDTLMKYRQHVSSEGYKNRARQLHFHKISLLDAYKRRGLEVPDWLPSMDAEISADQPSEADHHRKWAWWALRSGYVKSARKHALLALKKQPFNFENWNVFFCALRGS